MVNQHMSIRPLALNIIGPWSVDVTQLDETEVTRVRLVTMPCGACDLAGSRNVQVLA